MFELLRSKGFQVTKFNDYLVVSLNRPISTLEVKVALGENIPMWKSNDSVVILEK